MAITIGFYVSPLALCLDGVTTLSKKSMIYIGTESLLFSLSRSGLTLHQVNKWSLQTGLTAQSNLLRENLDGISEICLFQAGGLY